MTLTHLVTLISLLGFSANGNLPIMAARQVTERKQEIGFASYYGDDFHGTMMACGKPYDKNQLTAAHRTLPFGTRLLVTNLRNLRNVVVMITDRGPVRKDRLLDLSLAGARKLKMLRSGVVRVRAEALK